MGSTALERAIAERQRALRRAVGEELRRARQEGDLSMRAVSRAAGLHHSHLPRIEAGERFPSADALVALAAVMGYEVSIRLFASSGPRTRDGIQVRMIEALLRVLHRRWLPRLEVAVYRPVRGVIDVVLQDRVTSDLVAGEGHSALHVVEQQLRWAGQKADALPSAAGWPWADVLDGPRIGRLLLLRSSAANRELVRALPHTFATGYPASSADAVRALTAGDRPWPGAAIVWVQVEGRETRLLRGTPRGIPDVWR
jgi:transcriptional regulator with XRE-family HTH domain